MDTGTADLTKTQYREIAKNRKNNSELWRESISKNEWGSLASYCGVANEGINAIIKDFEQHRKLRRLFNYCPTFGELELLSDAYDLLTFMSEQPPNFLYEWDNNLTPHWHDFQIQNFEDFTETTMKTAEGIYPNEIQGNINNFFKAIEETQIQLGIALDDTEYTIGSVSNNTLCKTLYRTAMGLHLSKRHWYGKLNG